MNQDDIQRLLDDATGRFTQQVVNILADAPVIALTHLAASTLPDPQLTSQQTKGSSSDPAERATPSAPKRAPSKPASRPRSVPPALSERRFAEEMFIYRREASLCSFPQRA